MNTTTETKIKACTPKELAGMYGVSQKTLRTWLLPHQKQWEKERTAIILPGRYASSLNDWESQDSF